MLDLPPLRHRRAAAALILVIAGAQSAYAHKLNLFAVVEGATVRGSAYFADGPAKNVRVEVIGPDGGKLGEVKTDDTGAFGWTPEFRCDHRFTAETVDGHRAEFVVAANELPESLPALPAESVASRREAVPAPPPSAEFTAPASSGAAPAELQRIVEEAVSRELRPLREQLDRYESRTRFRDVLGGIGYIAGLAGLLAIYKGYCRKRNG